MDNRIEKVSKWCGFVFHLSENDRLLYYWLTPEGKPIDLPDINSTELLDWLFKYPVAKLKEYDFAGIYFLPLTDGRWHVKIDILPDGYECVNINPTEALLEAIIQIIKEQTK